jgi:hypothetical protein
MAHGNLKVIEGGSESVGTEKWSQKIRKKAKNLANDLDNGYMEMAHLLWQIYDTPVNGESNQGPVFTQWGYGSFAEYVQEELGIHKKRAQRLRNVWFNLEIRLKDQIDPAVKKRLVGLGFSKVRELVRVISARNVEKWVEKGEQLSYPKLCKAIQTYQEAAERRALKKQGSDAAENEEGSEGGSGEGGGGGGGGGPVAVDKQMKTRDEDGHYEPEVPDLTDDDMHPRRFMLYTEQAEMVDQALDRAKHLSNSDVKSNNLHLICMDFLAHNDFGKANKKTKLKYIAQMERILGFQLVVFDGDDVVYGIKKLEEAATAEEDE